jgi:hypothetical protein
VWWGLRSGGPARRTEPFTRSAADGHSVMRAGEQEGAGRPRSVLAQYPLASRPRPSNGRGYLRRSVGEDGRRQDAVAVTRVTDEGG